VSHEEQPEQLDAMLRDLLADEAEASEAMDPAQKERIRRRLEHALGLPPNGGPGDGSSSGAPTSPASSSSAGKLALVALAVAAGVIVRVLASPSPPADDVRAGNAETAGVQAHAEPARGPAPPSTAAEVAIPTLAVGDLPNAPPDRTPRTSPHSDSAVGTARGLAEERALIAAARGSLVSRRFDDAARLLREHETTFPDGQLVSEREALRVWWLEDTGQTEAANARAKQFHETYPNSLLRPGVEHRGL